MLNSTYSPCTFSLPLQLTRFLHPVKYDIVSKEYKELLVILPRLILLPHSLSNMGARQVDTRVSAMLTVSSHHIVKSYDDELKRLRDVTVAMGWMAIGEMSSALRALTERDADLASSVIIGDHQVDDTDYQINELTVRLLALRSPVADDLRTVITTLKMASELERIADLAVNIAKRAIILNRFPLLPPVHGILRMGEAVVKLVEEVVNAFSNNDVNGALAVWERDLEIDDQCSALFRELLTYMMEDPRNITACSHMMFIAKNIERVGDHATNIAEIIHYRVIGKTLRVQRPKGEMSPFRVD